MGYNIKTATNMRYFKIVLIVIFCSVLLSCRSVNETSRDFDEDKCKVIHDNIQKHMIYFDKFVSVQNIRINDKVFNQTIVSTPNLSSSLLTILSANYNMAELKNGRFNIIADSLINLGGGEQYKNCNRYFLALKGNHEVGINRSFMSITYFLYPQIVFPQISCVYILDEKIKGDPICSYTEE